MGNPVNWIIDKVKEINHFIWYSSLSDLSKRKSILIRQMRIIVLAARGFTNNDVQLRAASLTFYSILSVVPIAAIAFAIAKGFGLDQNLEQELIKNFKAHEEVLQWLLRNARNALDATKGGYIAGIGVVVLFWSVMSLLSHIENSFNHIWEIRISRPWYRKFTDYLTIMLIAPVFVILSSSVTVFVNTELNEFMTKAPILEGFKPIVSFLLKFTPYFLTWIVLTVLFIVMPNTRVRFRSAFVAALVAGTILQLVQWLYIDLQFGISKLSTIYGSFAAIPLFIVWMQVSWLIVLLGAELSFANQNVSRYEFESEALNISTYQKRMLTLLIMNLIVKNFARGHQPMGAETISADLKIPVRLVRDIVQDLNSVHLVSMVHKDDSKTRFYQPAIDISGLTINDVLTRLDRKGVEPRGIIKTRDYDKIEQILQKFEKMTSKSDMNVLIKDL
ncbi:MAG: YihY/virulence factor BrkB family protein [Bacteroidales bacterium]